MTDPTPVKPDSRNDNGDKELTPSHRRFFETAEPLFERFGYKKTTVEDVCRAAAMSKRTFYDLFKDKQDLLMQLTEAVIEDATNSWEASLPPDAEPLGKLHRQFGLAARGGAGKDHDRNGVWGLSHA